MDDVRFVDDRTARRVSGFYCPLIPRGEAPSNVAGRRGLKTPAQSDESSILLFDGVLNSL